MRKPTFNPEITMGHVLQLGTALIAMVGFYVNTRLDRQRMEMRAEAIERTVAQQDVRLGTHDETLRAIALTQVKMATILDERTAPVRQREAGTAKGARHYEDSN